MRNCSPATAQRYNSIQSGLRSATTVYKADCAALQQYTKRTLQRYNSAQSYRPKAKPYINSGRMDSRLLARMDSVAEWILMFGCGTHAVGKPRVERRHGEAERRTDALRTSADGMRRRPRAVIGMSRRPPRVTDCGEVQCHAMPSVLQHLNGVAKAAHGTDGLWGMVRSQH
jgi:hypothetical protein